MGPLRAGLGTPEDSFDGPEDCDLDSEISCLLELKEDMNSIDCGDSPRRLLKCSAASCFDRVLA